ncbi:regulator [Paenibacillus selenitireducens]|uniref:Regulator n=1 Tax=Paenibacillus selenitireducens TaxID=1324314 RepID=A0A1T2XF95_9BACL|nr:YlbF family regulator [Paenibacillus selenitireducens]OPA78564.1 regulator [Paenibacillus selenitireducens]
MSVSEINTIDMASLLGNAYELGDMINSSADVAEYIYWKQKVEQNAEVQQLVRELDKKKELFEETERFGHFHPNYHEAKDAVKSMEARLEEFEEVRRFKEQEQRLDNMLYDISKMIAHSVSETIKVPSNDPNPKGGGCGGGGSCSCG